MWSASFPFAAVSLLWYTYCRTLPVTRLLWHFLLQCSDCFTLMCYRTFCVVHFLSRNSCNTSPVLYFLSHTSCRTFPVVRFVVHSCRIFHVVHILYYISGLTFYVVRFVVRFLSYILCRTLPVIHFLPYSCCCPAAVVLVLLQVYFCL